VSKDKKPGSTASLHQKLADEAPEAGMLEHPSYEEMLQQLNEAEEKANQNWDRALRVQAEMQNVERRASMDVEKAHKYALEKFSMELLPVIDGLEMAMNAHANEDHQDGSLLDGVNMTHKMFKNALEKFGVVQVNPELQPFNPEHHQAVSTQVDPSVAPGTVLNVLQKGYLLNGRLIRPALVVVSKA